MADRDVIACRDRELSNLRALLRSVTIRLEVVGELLQEPNFGIDAQHRALTIVESVLEALS